jgi:hypothetical protein
MTKLDPARVKDFDRAIQPFLDQVGTLFKKRNRKKLAALMGEHATLVLLKSQRIYQGPQQILNFWKQLMAAGVSAVHFTVRKKVAKPADFLLADAVKKGVFVLYDMTHYSLGSYEFVGGGRKPGDLADKGLFLIVKGHPVTCQRELLLFVLDC